MKINRRNPPIKTQKVKRMLTINPIANLLSGCHSFVQEVQRKNKEKKKMRVKINRIFIPVAKISI